MFFFVLQDVDDRPSWCERHLQFGSMEDLSDEQLIERWRTDQGSPVANALLDELFRRHRTRVATWCFRLTGEVRQPTSSTTFC